MDDDFWSEFGMYAVAYVLVVIVVVGVPLAFILNYSTNSHVTYLTGETIGTPSSGGNVKLEAMEPYYGEWTKTWFRTEITRVPSPGFYLIKANGFRTVRSAEMLNSADLDLLGLDFATVY